MSREETPLADLLSDRQTADGCRVRTHLTQFAGQLEVSVHHSSEELKPNILISMPTSPI